MRYTYHRKIVFTTGLLALSAASAALAADPAATKPARPWLGLHVSVHGDAPAAALIEELPELARAGINTLVIEVGYGFEFDSHPELRAGGALSRAQARRLADACRKNGIRPIPELNCLGHQSWDKHTAPLLTKYPQFDETPGQFPDNKGIYCRSWCPLHPEVNRIVFALMDELIEAFAADAFHVGMDEVFLIGSEHCPRCKGKDPAELFAKAVNDYHAHLVGQRKIEMLMWGDRLLDAKVTGYGEWEAARNGTHPAVDRIPKDIILCDWHYGKRAAYPSIRYFLDKGFRVWPAGWDKVEATEALVDEALRQRGPRLLGHLCTVWGKARIPDLAAFPPLQAAMKKWGGGQRESSGG